ncbi:hypothetical protein FA10DRAFT_262480 [Acaromyces ingoldii]|uniref:C2H2-type domain-containing protein n=1 Tax=Acaromyces ingoldii TaxID=215250 RepID=A0A316YDV5_9BASI|nr:hypothetical protein FA10DRAFT_262480 [Acaromyces ingoldii]PWN87311.1 hypothetical protein FA10DRAFT_262480 [Acaromyces ingoldii]
MRCLYAITFASVFLSLVLGRDTIDKLSCIHDQAVTHQVVTASHKPLPFLPDRHKSATRVLGQQPSLSEGDRSIKPFQGESPGLTTHEVHPPHRVRNRQVTSPLGDNGDVATTTAYCNHLDKTSTYLVRRAVVHSHPHTVHHSIDIPPSSENAQNVGDRAMRLKRRGWIEQDAALEQELEASKGRLEELETDYVTTLAAIHSGRAPREMHLSTDDIVIAANKVTGVYLRYLAFLRMKQEQFRAITLNPSQLSETVLQAHDSLLKVNQTTLKVKEQMRNHIQFYLGARGLFVGGLSAKDWVGVSWESIDRMLADAMNEQMQSDALIAHAKGEATPSQGQQARWVKDEIEELCEMRLRILEENLKVFQELPKQGDIVLPHIGFVREQCGQLERRIHEVQEQCKKIFEDTKRKTVQRKGHYRRKSEASSSRQHLGKRDGSGLIERATKRHDWREGNQKALERVVYLIDSLKRLIEGRDKRGLAVHEMVKRCISQITTRYKDQLTALQQEKEKYEKSLGSRDLLGGIVELFEREVKDIGKAMEDVQTQLRAHCQKFNISGCGEGTSIQANDQALQRRDATSSLRKLQGIGAKNLPTPPEQPITRFEPSDERLNVREKKPSKKVNRRGGGEGNGIGGQMRPSCARCADVFAVKQHSSNTSSHVARHLAESHPQKPTEIAQQKLLNDGVHEKSGEDEASKNAAAPYGGANVAKTRSSRANTAIISKRSTEESATDDLRKLESTYLSKKRQYQDELVSASNPTHGPAVKKAKADFEQIASRLKSLLDTYVDVDSGDPSTKLTLKHATTVLYERTKEREQEKQKEEANWERIQVIEEEKKELQEKYDSVEANWANNPDSD